MRTYPRNSPQAAARLVAMAALADGHLSLKEIQKLEQAHAAQRLGLSAIAFSEVLQCLSEDLLATAFTHCGTACQLDADVLPALLSEVDDPALRHAVIALCVEVAQADSHLLPSECGLIAGMVLHWQDVPHGRQAAAAVLQPART